MCAFFWPATSENRYKGFGTMLKRNDAITDQATLCAKSMSGRCVQLSDLLNTFSSAPMRELSNRYPMEMLKASELVSGAIASLIALHHMIEEDV